MVPALVTVPNALAILMPKSLPEMSDAVPMFETLPPAARYTAVPPPLVMVPALATTTPAAEPTTGFCAL